MLVFMMMVADPSKIEREREKEKRVIPSYLEGIWGLGQRWQNILI